MTNAPSTFAMLMNKAFAHLVGVCVVVYLNDIIIFSKSQEEHLLHIHQVLETQRSNQLKAKPSKCKFLKKELLSGAPPDLIYVFSI